MNRLKRLKERVKHQWKLEDLKSGDLIRVPFRQGTIYTAGIYPVLELNGVLGVIVDTRDSLIYETNREHDFEFHPLDHYSNGSWEFVKRFESNE